MFEDQCPAGVQQSESGPGHLTHYVEAVHSPIERMIRIEEAHFRVPRDGTEGDVGRIRDDDGYLAVKLRQSKGEICEDESGIRRIDGLEILPAPHERGLRILYGNHSGVGNLRRHGQRNCSAAGPKVDSNGARSRRATKGNGLQGIDCESRDEFRLRPRNEYPWANSKLERAKVGHPQDVLQRLAC